jgi:hypothetical protein
MSLERTFKRMVLGAGALALSAGACSQQERPALPKPERFSAEYYAQTYGPSAGDQYAAACADFAVSAAFASQRAEEFNRYGQYASVDSDSEYQRFVEVAGMAGEVRDNLEASHPEINNEGQCGENAMRALRIAGLD